MEKPSRKGCGWGGGGARLALRANDGALLLLLRLLHLPPRRARTLSVPAQHGEHVRRGPGPYTLAQGVGRPPACGMACSTVVHATPKPPPSLPLVLTTHMLRQFPGAWSQNVLSHTTLSAS